MEEGSTDRVTEVLRRHSTRTVLQETRGETPRASRTVFVSGSETLCNKWQQYVIYDVMSYNNLLGPASLCDCIPGICLVLTQPY